MMKKIVLILLGAFLLGGCKKEELPLKCNDLVFEYAPYAPSAAIDSVYLYLQRTDVHNGEVFDTMLYSSQAQFPFSFCGVFKYRVRVYNSTPGIKYDMHLRMNGYYELIGGPRVVNGHIDDNYETEFEFRY